MNMGLTLAEAIVIATIIVSTLALRLIFKSFTGNEEAA